MKEAVRKELNKWKGMDKKQKREYFNDYYRAKVIVIVIGIVMLFSIASEVRMSKREVVLSGCMVNTNISEEGKKLLTTDYLERMKKSPKKSTAYLGECYIDFEPAEQVMDSNSDQMVLYAQIAAREYDYLLLDSSALWSMAYMDVYDDLRLILEEDELKELEPNIVMLPSQTGEGGEFPAAIALSGTETFKKYGFTTNQVYLVFTSTNHSEQKTKELMKYILLQDKE